MARWPFHDRRSPGEPEILPETAPLEETSLAAGELLEILRWHIDRYDRLRASTSARASILLSASSVLLTGIILFVNHRIQARSTNPIGYPDIALVTVIAITGALTLASIANCINAIAAWKTSRSMHNGEIPNRFLFNWGDTIKSVDGYTAFAERVTNLDSKAILGHATAELWTDISQHRTRHKYLRTGIMLFRYSIISFVVLAALTLWIIA